jgi:hypothetical protein
MNCPPDIAAVALAILQMGIIRTRCFAIAANPRRCLIEADHIHNLPDLVRDYRPERLRYYWDIERPSFIAQVPESERGDLEPLWNEMAELIQRHGIPERTPALPNQQMALSK